MGKEAPEVDMWHFLPQKSRYFSRQDGVNLQHNGNWVIILLMAGFKYFLFSTLPGEMIHFD